MDIKITLDATFSCMHTITDNSDVVIDIYNDGDVVFEIYDPLDFILAPEQLRELATAADWLMEEAIRRCINCGTPLADNTSYCERCGFENNDLLK